MAVRLSRTLFAQLAQQKWGDAAQRLDEASRTFAKDADVQVALGYAYQKLQRHDDAVAAFDRAIALQAAHPQAHAFKGISLEQLGQATQALDSYKAATGNAQGQALSASKTKLAVAAYKEKRFEESRALAQAAVEADPKNAHARYMLGVSAYVLGDRKTAGEQEYELERMDPQRAASLRTMLAEKPKKE